MPFIGGYIFLNALFHRSRCITCFLVRRAYGDTVKPLVVPPLRAEPEACTAPSGNERFRLTDRTQSYCRFNPLIWTGVLLLVVLPPPSAPYKLSPQAKTVPSLFTASVCNTPADMNVTPEIYPVPPTPFTCTGLKRSTKKPSPNGPSLLFPQDHIEPSLFSTSECRQPAAIFDILFNRLIRDIAALGYDYTVFDMSPGASILERFIVSAVDEALPILRPEVFSVDGLEIFLETLEGIREDLGGRVASPRLVINGLNQSIAVHRAYAEALSGKGREVFIIPQSARITSAQTERLFLSEYANLKENSSKPTRVDNQLYEYYP